MNLKQKLKTFFKTKDSSESAVELLRKFILPFMAQWDSRASIDDAVAAFFAVEKRKFYHARAKRPFKMPGHYMLAGNRPTKRFGAREVVKGQYMLLAIDRIEQNVRVQIDLGGKERMFTLSRPEMEFLKDYVEVMEA